MRGHELQILPSGIRACLGFLFLFVFIRVEKILDILLGRYACVLVRGDILIG